ncbi:hypothetical protein JCM7686_2076 [Paracoccus aminophilus JCM 7686]|uniref:Uncharacterized protein n=1 Tax=Paracoccus aminophilus JCM 7686 TaxID=1367847 RepID=S5XV96_PARAH|nr:hypothetical protein JCM7686_2076 [Paracoccus aminophilus JCM 7686]
MEKKQNPPVLRTILLRLMATAGVSAAVLLSWWWKIEDARAPKVLPTAALNQPVDLGRSLFTPQRVTLERGATDQIMLTAVIENVTGASQSSVFGLPAKPPELILDGKGVPPAEIILLRDHAPLAQIEPRMPEEIALIWPLPAGQVPSEIRFGFSKERFKLRDNLYGQSSWLGAAPTAILTATPEILP